MIAVQRMMNSLRKYLGIFPKNVVEWRTNVVEWRTELQRVQTSLHKEHVKLNRSDWRDDIFDIMAKADGTCIIFVNTNPLYDQLRYKVYTPTGG